MRITIRAMTLTRIGALLLGTVFCLPVLADTQFRVRRTSRNDIPLGRGQCDIRLQVDNEVEVSVRGDNVFIRTLAGRDAYDDGQSECNMPLPARRVSDSRSEVRDRRGEFGWIADPSRRNNYTAVVLIRASWGGRGRSLFRLTWDRAGPGRPPAAFDARPRQGPPGFAW